MEVIVKIKLDTKLETLLSKFIEVLEGKTVNSIAEEKQEKTETSISDRRVESLEVYEPSAIQVSELIAQREPQKSDTEELVAAKRERVQGLISKLIKTQKLDEIRALVEKQGVAKVSNVPAENLDVFIQELEALTNG